MRNSDILESVGCSIGSIIGDEWKHEVSLFGMSSCHLNFEIDQKEYVLVLHEVKDGHDWGEYVYVNSEKE